MDCPFYIGQRVTPIGKVVNKEARAEGIHEGGVYTISGMYLYSSVKKGDVVLLQFKETRPPRGPRRPPNGGWLWNDFRPVTDISSLEALLKTTKTPEHV